MSTILHWQHVWTGPVVMLLALVAIGALMLAFDLYTKED